MGGPIQNLAAAFVVAILTVASVSAGVDVSGNTNDEHDGAHVSRALSSALAPVEPGPLVHVDAAAVALALREDGVLRVPTPLGMLELAVDPDALTAPGARSIARSGTDFTVSPVKPHAYYSAPIGNDAGRVGVLVIGDAVHVTLVVDGRVASLAPAEDALALTEPLSRGAPYRWTVTPPSISDVRYVDIGLPGGGGPQCEGPSSRDVIVDADYAFYVRDPSTVEDRQAQVASAAKTVWDSQLCFTFVVADYAHWVGEDAWSTNPHTLLTQFTTHWEDPSHDEFERDLVHLLTGKDLDGNAVGIAHQNGCCDADSATAYSLHEARTPYDSFFNSVLMPHELGHLFSGDHPLAVTCGPSACACPTGSSTKCTILSEWYVGPDRQRAAFTSNNRDVIEDSNAANP